MVTAPSVAALTNAGRGGWTADARFWLALSIAAVVSGLVGIRVAGSQLGGKPRLVGGLTGSFLFAVLYPAAVLLPLTFASDGTMLLEGSTPALRWLVPVALAVAVGLLPLFCRASRRPRRAFQLCAAGWVVVGLVFVPVLGLGLVFLPLALSNHWAAESNRGEDPITAVASS